MTKTNDSIYKSVVIAEINRMIENLKSLNKDFATLAKEHSIETLKTLLDNIESITPSPTIESLLEEMDGGTSITKMRSHIGGYNAISEGDETRDLINAVRDTPLEALLSLKDKLSN